MNATDNKTKHSGRNWDELSLENDPVVLRELLKTYKEGYIEELGEALEKCYDASVKWTRHELWDHLKDLMYYVLLMQHNSEFRTQDNWEKICRLRSEIEDDFENNECLVEKDLNNKYPSAFDAAKDLAETYAPKVSAVNELSRKDIFETSYHPNNYVK